MNDSEKLTPLLKGPIQLERYTSPLIEKKEDVDAVASILSDSVKYFNLSLKAQDPALDDIRNGLMIASITLFFSCFEKNKKRYGLKASIYEGNSSMYNQYESFKKIRHERIAHRGPRKANSGAMRPVEPAMRENILIMNWGDASHVPFAITKEEIQAFKGLLEFTLRVFEKDYKACEEAILEESAQTSSKSSTSTHHRGKGRKNKKNKRRTTVSFSSG